MRKKIVSYTRSNISIAIFEVEEESFKFFEITKEDIYNNKILQQTQYTSVDLAHETFHNWIQEEGN